MESALRLPEAAAGHAGETRFVQQLEAVEHVWSLGLPLGLLDECRRQRDAREGVHGACKNFRAVSEFRKKLFAR